MLETLGDGFRDGPQGPHVYEGIFVHMYPQ